ncbi:hypothetical protein BJ165DRAFT_932032 [Panaeolus papilionaceus]|nr:hypothetical protein BJ165DRAFT_932032 [Panaeolus papilionaceus]
MSTRPKVKRVSFSASDQIISVPSPDSSSESDSEELRAAMKGLALEGVQEEGVVKPSPNARSYVKGSSPPSMNVPIPPTPRLRPKELPVDDSSQSGGRVASASHASASGAGSRTTNLSPNSRPSSHLPSSSARTAPGTAKPETSHRANAKSSTADDALTLILSTRLTSGDPYTWDITTDPRIRKTRLSRMMEEDGDLPAAFSARSQGPYTGELTLRHPSVPLALAISPRPDADYVTIQDVFEALYAFMRCRVGDDELSAEGKQRQAQIKQAALSRTRAPRPEVRRIDCLLGYTTFRGLSLGKDGETIIIHTSAAYQR